MTESVRPRLIRNVTQSKESLKGSLHNLPRPRKEPPEANNAGHSRADMGLWRYFCLVWHCPIVSCVPSHSTLAPIAARPGFSIHGPRRAERRETWYGEHFYHEKRTEGILEHHASLAKQLTTPIQTPQYTMRLRLYDSMASSEISHSSPSWSRRCLIQTTIEVHRTPLFRDSIIKGAINSLMPSPTTNSASLRHSPRDPPRSSRQYLSIDTLY